MQIPADDLTEIVLPEMPESIFRAGLRYSVDAGQLDWLRASGIVLPDTLARAVLKRQVEFAAGRFCARARLAARVRADCSRQKYRFIEVCLNNCC